MVWNLPQAPSLPVKKKHNETQTCGPDTLIGMHASELRKIPPGNRIDHYRREGPQAETGICLVLSVNGLPDAGYNDLEGAYRLLGGNIPYHLHLI